MSAPTIESALLVAARQLADEALERSRRPRVPRPRRRGPVGPAHRGAPESHRAGD